MANHFSILALRTPWTLYKGNITILFKSNLSQLTSLKQVNNVTLSNVSVTLESQTIRELKVTKMFNWFSSVAESVSDSLWPHGLQHARLPCPSPTPGPWSISCTLSWWCPPTISSFVICLSSAFNLSQHQEYYSERMKFCGSKQHEWTWRELFLMKCHTETDKYCMLSLIYGI